jgi:hypothetical protein
MKIKYVVMEDDCIITVEDTEKEAQECIDRYMEKINMPTMKEILSRVEKKRGELPKIVQVVPHDWDAIVLADTIRALRPYLRHDKDCQILDNWNCKKGCDCGLGKIDLGD